MALAGQKNGYDPSNVRSDSVQATWNGLTKEERNEYIEKYSPLIRYISDRIAARLPAHVSRDDLVSSGILGLIDAVDKFDPKRKIMFKTYAEFRIKGAMLDELRSMDWVPRSVRRKSSQVEKAFHTLEASLGRPAVDEEVAESLGLSMTEFHRLLDEVKCVSLLDIDAFRGSFQSRDRTGLFDLQADETTHNPLVALGLSEAKSVVAKAVSSLPEKEKLVVSMYYYHELTMKEIGQAMGYTESRISQLHTKALMRLKARLRGYFDTRGA
ncbi:MAG: FliA/WhiG family RNA polymerase sigma factor [Thermodesulfobacteriota bacterium]|nr:FliA/WhiG family RNA polymerase sigma factor [Thermodesulfobacteriota bacterium]